MRSRLDAIGALRTERFDVLVVGGGITGAGVALDAASRGYSVALVEQADFASGTSGRSSKLVHGGLRYLQSLDLGLVREALLERALMVRLAPQLVRPVRFVVPSPAGQRPDRMMGIGLNLYDVMASPPLRGRIASRRHAAQPQAALGGAEWHPGRHRLISGAEVSELLPALAARRPAGGYLFYDCQTDDARLVLTVLAEAERHGAVCVRGVQVTGFSGGRTRARDTESGEELTVGAGRIVNATGVWADRLGGGAAGPALPSIAPSRGTHVTLAPEALPLRAGAIVPAGDGRSIFAAPWLGRILVGTTDNAYEGPIEHVRPAGEDVDYLLRAVDALFGTALCRGDVTGAFAGVRPLIAGADGRRSVDISRRAELSESAGGMITITGGKLTTWRRMAKLAVDRLVQRDGRTAPCRTHEIPLGAGVDPAVLPRVPGVAAEAYGHLARRYGHLAAEVLELAASDRSLALPILPGLPDIAAEAAYAAAREQALTVGDVLLRRTRLGLLAGRALCAPGAGGPEQVARAIGGVRGWGQPRVAAEVAAFGAEAGAEGIDLSELDSRVPAGAYGPAAT